MGFTPDLLVVVWVGFDRSELVGLSGAQAALPIWIEFMKAATAGQRPTPFLVPPGIETAWIDPLSGGLATVHCPERLEESFLEGEAPTAAVSPALRACAGIAPSGDRLRGSSHRAADPVASGSPPWSFSASKPPATTPQPPC